MTWPSYKQTERFFGKSLVLNTQSNSFGIIGSDDLKEECYIAHILKLEEEQGKEVEEFLDEIIVTGWASWNRADATPAASANHHFQGSLPYNPRHLNGGDCSYSLI